uniref:Uncharacterized protein n=1 Tax=Tanacetum cinerariifolium TaxID=118510 RepID=A0A6L2LN37_TANCI|nr:hypothetical protein [Tanacetum cinerariifolium]
MDRRLLITKLRYKVDSSDWTDVLSYFCREAADDDRRIAMKLNRLCEKMLIVCEKRRNLADELTSIRGIVVVGKATEFVTCTLRKDNAQVAQLCKVESQMEFRALKKELFIQKLVGNGVFHAPVGPIRVSVVELAHAADSNDIRDQLSVLFRRQVNEDSERMNEYRRLSYGLREGLRVRAAYIEELQMFQVFHSSDEVVESLEIMKGMQLDDVEKASRLLLMAREVQNKVYEKNKFVIKLRG